MPAAVSLKTGSELAQPVAASVSGHDAVVLKMVGLVFQEVRISYGQGEEAGGGDGVRGCGSAQT